MISETMQYEKKFASIAGKQIAYVEEGSGDPIVLLHGNPTSSFLWRNIIPELTDIGRVIVPDLIGQGDSEKLPASEGPDRYSLEVAYNYVDGLLETIGANTNVQTDYGFTPIYFAVGKKGDEEIVKMLIEHGALTNIKDRNGITPLHYAAWGTPNKVKILLEAGADVKAKTNSGKTAFDLGQDNEQLVNSNVYILLKLVND